MKKLLAFILSVLPLTNVAQSIRVGAKHFNEGYIISEITAQLLEQNGYEVTRIYNLGGTLVCFEALRTDAIDVYPEYTGTIASEILKSKNKLSIADINRELAEKFNMEISGSMGFSNSYGLVMMPSVAAEKKIVSISDLSNHPEILTGLSYEFLKRKDGWDNLAKHYNLSIRPAGLEHGLAYQALRESKIEITDAYTTDGEIARYGLQLLRDDLSFFPEYEAVSLYSKNTKDDVKNILKKLDGIFSEEEVQRLNASVLFEKKTFAEVAHGFLLQHGFIKENVNAPVTSTSSEIISKTITHLELTFAALLIAIIIALPLGVFLYWNPALAKPIVYTVGLLQTIPSIALLAMMIPLLGIGIVPALVALFLYALLPILRNTVAGLQSVDPMLKNVADGMGLTKWQKLIKVEFPLASPVILSGVRTASVINVGTATLAAFIGAGGLGEFIVTGLALNNTSLILQGAVPAALLAIVMELFFELVSVWSIPKPLRTKR